MPLLVFYIKTKNGFENINGVNMKYTFTLKKNYFISSIQ